jgi:cytochrome c-type biogenesis protein CcmH
VRLLAALLAVLAFAGPAAATAVAAGCPRTSLGDLEDEVMCVLCKRPLSTVDAEPQAQRERAFIQAQIAQCRSKSEIKNALVAQYGPKVLSVPESKGFDATAFIVPVLLPLAALAAIVLTAMRWRRTRRPGTAQTGAATPAAPGAGPALDPGDAARLDEDLERYKL